MRFWVLFFVVWIVNVSTDAQHSIAREWNEVNLQAIRDDFARPTVHARNLFHLSIAMYDVWSVYDDQSTPYLLGKEVNGFNCPFDGVPATDDIDEARAEAISYAAYRLILHRYQNSPGSFETLINARQLMSDKSYDWNITDTTYQSGVPAHLGNYIAAKIIEYGFQDGANEQGLYRNRFYEPVNAPLVIQRSGNPDISDLNRWQPLSLRIFIDQSGNQIPGDTPEFLGPEWGEVAPFALKSSESISYERDGYNYIVYHDPGSPVLLDESGTGDMSDAYKWGFSMVSIWGAHLDPDDGVMWDISPSFIGNNPVLPIDYRDYDQFYNYIEGGDASLGHDVNPATDQPYLPNIVPRGDYARVLAEFWADGPDSETPPGHWFTILNKVNDDPLLQKRYKGEGEELDDLEWDVKAYLALGGAMHDCAIAAWGIKGWYDYIRPVSAIRGMAELGQSSEPDDLSYDPRGLPLVEGYIEIVRAGDPLAGPENINVGKIKVYSWRGPDFIDNPDSDVAGVGWILAEEWWPYQRPSFVTPPFAGYVSGHSTYSRAAAELMTLLTGDPFFPGGMGEFVAKRNEFLVFEDGPSEDVVLQWATYQDASDQTSLSRIWGGIHPPIDDIPGRIIGEKIGISAFNKADNYFNGVTTSTEEVSIDKTSVLSLSPNPVKRGLSLTMEYSEVIGDIHLQIIDIMGRIVYQRQFSRTSFSDSQMTVPKELASGTYIVSVKSGNKIASRKIQIH